MTHSTHHNTTYEELSGSARQIFNRLKELVQAGVARRFIVRDKEESKVIVDIPMVVGVAGTVFATSMAPVLAGVGLYVFFLNDVSILVQREVEHENGDDSEERIIDIENGDE